MEWNLGTYSAAVAEGYLWFSNNTFNSLFRMNISTKNIEWVAFFPEEDIHKCLLHKKCFYFGGKLFFVPAFSDYIHVYDIRSNTFDSIKYVLNNNEITGDRVSDCVAKDNELFMFPLFYGEDLKILNMKTGEFKVVPEFKEAINSKLENNDGYMMLRCQLDANGEFVFAVAYTDLIAKWNHEKKCLGLEKCGIDNIFSCNVIDGEKWIIQKECENIYKIDQTGKVHCYRGLTQFSEEKKGTVDRYYNRIIGFDGRIIALPAMSEYLCNVCDGVVESFLKYDKLDCQDNVPLVFDAVVVGEELWIMPFYRGSIYILNNKGILVDNNRFELKNDEYRNVIEKTMKYSHLTQEKVLENTEFNLGEFIETVAVACNSVK